MTDKTRAEIAAEEINLLLSKKFHEVWARLDRKFDAELLAILTELMDPIGEEEIQERSEKFCPYTNDFNTIDTLKRSCFKLGARWAATRNLKVSLEGLMVYEANREGDLWEVCKLNELSDEDKKDEFREYCLKLSDVEKLVG